ncbi:MAG: hypothetical protein IPJ07_17135 [Acidobacteria bacterium]|nr:hypothetical protein [Acidobacteriota bacterium]
MMKRLMFYSQPVLGIGHLVRSLEIVRGLGDLMSSSSTAGRRYPSLTSHLALN